MMKSALRSSNFALFVRLFGIYRSDFRTITGLFRGTARLAAGALLLLAASAAAAFDAPAPPAAGGAPAVAFYYAANPPIDELRAFDWVVLEPDHAGAPTALPAGTAWFAYVSVGQVHPSRRYFTALQARWIRGHDPGWRSALIDQAAEGWTAFFLDEVLAPLWAQGWRGFFLDTLDAYQGFAANEAERGAQARALAALLDAAHERFPGARWIFNRGFELLPRLRHAPDAVAAESLFDSWDPIARAYGPVAPADSAWLRERLADAQRRYRAQAIAIDYRPLAQRGAARATAARIRAAGFIPWVATPGLDSLGVGSLEVQPRRVALIADRPDGTDMALTEAQRFLAMPLAYLGYAVEPYDVRGPLPQSLLDGRYAAVVTWFSAATGGQNPDFEAWLGRQIEGGVKWIAINELGIDLVGALARRLGLAQATPPPIPVDLSGPLAAAGFEAEAPRFQRMPDAVRATGAARVLLHAGGAERAGADAVALTAWGGYALAPYAITLQAPDEEPRWVVDPIGFLHDAIGAEPAPVPDVTTEGGRRILFVHVDGDGFSSRAELPGSPFAGEVLIERVLQRYPVPTALSVVEAEITGAADAQAPQLRAIARRAFALPNVELASHSYSHPFRWQALEHAGARESADASWNLAVPGYRFDLDREIAGSADFIERELAPPGKTVRLFFWSGDCLPDAQALAATAARGLLNLNGGGTIATRSQPSLTNVTGLGLLRGGRLQVYAPVQNENEYTNLWTGPFYGYQRVIETFELTGAPRRLKPIDIYFHFYSATKPAALAALDRVYGWALAQPVTALFASDYALKVEDFYRSVVARDWRDAQPRWRVVTAGDLRSVRLPEGAALDAAASRQVAGAAPGPDGSYALLAAASAELALGDGRAQALSVEQAAGWISDWSQQPASPGAARPVTTRFVLHSYASPEFTLANARACRVAVDGRALAAPAGDGGSPRRYVLPDHHADGTRATAYRVQVDCA